MRRLSSLSICSISLIFMFLWSSCSDQLREKSVEMEGLNEYNQSKSLLQEISSPYYYYYNGEKQFFQIAPEKEFVLLEGMPSETLSLELDYITEPKRVVVSSITPIETSLVSSERSWAIVRSSDALLNNDKILYRSPVFLSESNENLASSHLLYVKLKSEADVTKLKLLEEKFKIKLLGKNKFMPLWFTFECMKESVGNSLEISRRIYETGEFSEAYPDLISLQSDALCVNDSRFQEQWHLASTMYALNLCAVRESTTGNKNVIVAVLDQGIQLDHPDLNLYRLSYDTETGISPSKVYGSHGTNCAGFISAKTNNSIGIASLAPGCRLMSISNTLIGSLDSSQKRANGINFAWKNGASVISNSWRSGYPTPMLDDAIKNATTQGRNGKGSVVVFATGNNSGNSIDYPSSINTDGLIAVGASNSTGRRASFSQYGNGLDVVAPGESVLTTNVGSSYSSGSGTSFATPLVAATSALLISVNSNLTAKDVEAAICKTATKLQSYSFVSQNKYGSWNIEMGYGLLNPIKAIQYAKNTNSNCLVYFNDKTVTSNSIIDGCAIEATNLVLKSRVNLTFKADDYILLNPPMLIEYGSDFTMRLN